MFVTHCLFELSLTGDVDEEIVTLPETPTTPIKPSSPFKRHIPEDSNGTSSKKAKETTLLSSGESSPDPDSAENRKLKNGSGAGSPEKIPPKTYPKPDWYLKSRKSSMSPPPPLLSPERVKVVVSSLPSPQKVTSTSTTSHDVAPLNVARNAESNHHDEPLVRF